MFTSTAKTPLHVSVLLCFLAAIGLIHFYIGWIDPGPSDLFPGLLKEGEGAVHLFAANGSRQLAIAVLLLLGAFTRKPEIVVCGLLIRMICEAFDVFLYGVTLQQTGPMAVASGLLVWEIFALAHIYNSLQRRSPH